MTKTTKIVSLLAVILLLIGAIFVFTPKKSVAPQVNEFTVTPVPTDINATPTQVTPTSKYTDEVRAKVRSTFIANCQKYYGQKYLSACNCAADYLRANYTDAQLETIYYQYHSSSSTPAAIKTAYDLCKDK